jgi:ubiquinone/menaquinone biosynthesis methyltransferase
VTAVRPRFALKIRDHLHTPEKKRLYNEKVFTEIAPRYAVATRALSLGRDAAWKRRLVDALPPRESPLCVDLACGTGDIVSLLVRKYPGGRIVGLDLTGPMLEAARARNGGNPGQNVWFTRQDMGATGLLSGSVDILTGGYALRNAPDIEGGLDEVARILKPGGFAAFLDFSKPRDGFLQIPEYWLLKTWGGFWGLVLHRNPEVYGYIAASLRLFPDRDRLRELLQERGVHVVHSERFYFGITELLVLRKEEPQGFRQDPPGRFNRASAFQTGRPSA